VSSRRGELVVKDSIATISVPEGNILTNFLQGMIAKAMVESDHSMLCNVKNASSQSDTHKQKSGWGIASKGAVKGQQIVMSSSLKLKTVAAAAGTVDEHLSTLKPMSPPSPFSSAFFGTDEPKVTTHAKLKSKGKTDKDSSFLSFEDAFLDAPKANTSQPATDVFDYDFNDVDDTAAASSLWTKQRVKGLEGKIAAIAAGANDGVEEKISLTKEMLAEAQVIAQVEEKFIIIKARGVLLCVDQHVADERVALEKLERALFCPEMHDRMVIHMTHKSLMVSDILTRSKLIPPKRISLTQKDMATVKHHWSLIQKWKFTLEESDDKTLLLTGLASVCDRVASMNDFMEFVKELGHFTGGEIKPAFVKNVLASNACRYAIMFGDSLTHEKCVELISSLSKCEFCFICAHGRPSVIPLIDMNKDVKQSSTIGARANKDDTKVRDGNLRFGPKRVIRR